MARKIALLIANSDFRHRELARLSAPQTDVLSFENVLRNPKIGHFDIVQVKIDASLVDARRAIGALYRDSGPDDLVLFYYSGHGLRDLQGEFHLAMPETDPTDPAPGSIDEHWLRRTMDNSLSRRQIAIFDCCHSGAMIPRAFPI